MKILNSKTKFLQKVIFVLTIYIVTDAFIINRLSAQCDPTNIDPCEIKKNSIIQASYHAQIIKTSNGYSITGEDLAPNGTNYQVVLTNIPSSTYPMPFGVFPVWGAIGGRSQAVFLGSDGKIYCVGQQDLLIDNSITQGSSWRVSSLTLPSGITVCDVNKWEGTAGSGNNQGNSNGQEDGFLVFSTSSGELYITGDGASNIQAQASNTSWTKLIMPIGINVVDFAVGYRTLLVQGSDGNIYASGSNTYLGDGIIANLSSLTQLNTQPPISGSGIVQIEAGSNSFLLLDGDGTIHVLGENSEGSLGVGHNNDVTRWSKVGQECTSGILRNVAYISTLSTHNYRSASSAILVDETIRSWGTNDNQSITSGTDRIIFCPEIPTGNNMSAVAISNGGHITPYVNTAVQICNIGHNRQGAFGDGNDEEKDYGTYTCLDIPGLPEICGTNRADLELVKTASDSFSMIGSEITFTITITNNGPDASSGSTVRDQLLSGFSYLSDNTNGAYNSVTGLWVVGPLDIGESISLMITAKVLSSGDYSNYAQVFSDSEVDPDSAPGDFSNNQDDDDSVIIVVPPCPYSASCKTITSIEIDDCKSLIPFIYDAGNLEGSIEDFFTDITTCGVEGIFHRDNVLMENDCSSITRTYTLTDDGNEIISCSRIFTFDEDIEGPVITCPSDITLTCGESKPTPKIQLEGSDNCSPASFFAIVDIQDVSLDPDLCTKSNGTVQRIYEAIDDCENTSTCVQLLYFEREYIYVPNVFSPNSSLNKEWVIFPSSNVIVKETRIFDRWGNLIFSNKSDQPLWDGELNGMPCAQGVYIYGIKYEDSKGLDQMVSGSLTLIR
ncbi:T9SS type B sorting domain-containing protein [Portibacter lacus]|uniref:DUF11 domain-containing protein n=1 Tax=Portibacter lacus TaxID=1099794 RepID=A0AA37SNZ4_9BACT|nr:gliding motility-associated C-terminal domain-containing protein [Portibacter lacus]GLR17245.1 hypothetical protein GCM10007940_18600 [Portibacter lacus]